MREESNAYRAPEGAPQGAGQGRVRAVYSPGQLAVGGLIGLPIAGCWMLRANFAAFGMAELRRSALVWGVLGTIAAVAAIFLLPRPLGHVVAHGGSAGAVAYAGSILRGVADESRVADDTTMHPWWRALATGAAFFVATYGALIALFLSIWFLLTPA